MSSPAALESRAVQASDPVPQEPQPSRLRAHLALLAVQFCFGLFPVFGIRAFAAGGFEPGGVAAWRLIGGASVMGILGIVFHGRRMIPKRSDLPLLITCAFVGVAFNQGFYLEGLARSTAINSGVIMCLIPVFTFVAAAVAGQERLQFRRGLGVTIACAGAWQLYFSRGDATLAEHWHGNLLITGTAFCFSIFLVISRPLAARMPALVATAWMYIFALVSLPFFLRNASLMPADTGSLLAWSSLAYIVAVPTIIGYLLNMYAIGKLRASTVATYVYLQPIITGVASVYVLGEEPTSGALTALSCAFVGIYLVTKRTSPGH